MDDAKYLPEYLDSIRKPRDLQLTGKYIVKRKQKSNLFIDKLCNNRIEKDLWCKKILFLTVGCINYDCDINFYEPLTHIFSKVINYNYIRKLNQLGKGLMNAEVIEIVRKEKPDYVLLHAYQDQVELKTLDTLDALGTKVIAWFSDDHWRFENYSKVMARHVFCSVTTDKHAVDKYVKSGLNVIQSQWAANQNYYKKVDSKFLYDVSFVGQNYGRRKEKLTYLRNSGVPIVVFGRGFGRFLEFNDIVKVFNASKINLNFSGSSLNDDIKQIKGRIFEVPMCGGFLLTEHVDGIEEYFEIGKEIDCFEDVNEAIEKIQYYLKYEDKRMEIAEAGHARALKGHTWEKRLKDVFYELEKFEEKIANSCYYVGVAECEDHRAEVGADVNFNIQTRKQYEMGFHGDKYLLALFDSVLAKSDVFIETGAYMGDTLEYVARTFGHLRIFSCEPKEEHLLVAKKKLSNLRDNVHLVQTLSPHFLYKIVEDYPDLINKDVVFWLDAHSFGYKWPLKDEVRFITETFNKAYIFIDDFKIPGKPCFQYDVHDDQECSLEFIRNELCSSKEYSIYLPQYEKRTSKHHPLVGWALIEFGHHELSLPALLEGEVIKTNLHELFGNNKLKTYPLVDTLENEKQVINVQKKRVLLTTSAAPSQSPFSTTEKRPPVGIGFLISVLRNAGHRVFFIDNYLQPSDFLETDYLQENEIDYVGIYANTICFRDTLRMVRQLEHLRQTRKWKGRIIIGGPHAAVAPDMIPDCVDYIVQGEGEQAICDIVEGKVTDRIVKYPRIKNLDELPMPAWDYFVGLPYDWTVALFDDKPVFTMNTSRGCPFKCTFCSVGSIWGNRYTCFGAERIVSDIEYLIEHYGAKGIYFREDNFTLNEQRLSRFCHLLIEKGIKISWACESRVSNLSRDLVELMSSAGAKGFYFGVESGSQRILDFLQKGINVEQIENAFKWCHEFNVRTAASVIVGVPGETEADCYQTSELLKKINPTVTWFNVFVGIPDSNLYRLVLNNRLYQYIDDRGLVYLQGHNSNVERYYRGSWNAYIPDKEQNKDWTNKPKVSVLICVYNGEKFVSQALESIYHQTFQDFEVIVVDDGSTDRTADILINMKDSRTFIYRNSENQGLTKSLNIGLRLCRGQYIARMDADDVSTTYRLAKQIQFVEENPGVALVGSSYYQINDEGKTIALINVLTDCQQIKQGLWKQNWFGHGTVMFRREVVAELGGYNEKYKFSQDYDLWLRIAQKYKVSNIDEPLYYWRSNTACISNADRQQQQYYKNMAISEAHKRQSCQHPLIAQSLRQAKSSPMVSVIVPTYNRLDLLARALNSILNQTYQNFEIVIVNDAGEDVEPLLQKLEAKQRIVYLTHKINKGLAAARNTGIRAASGRYIAYLDDDDIYLPDHLETLCTVLESTDYRVAYTDAYRTYQRKVNGKYKVTERTIPYSFDLDHDQLLVRNLVPVLCVMHEKSCLDEVGYFDESLPTHEDWDLWIRMSRKFEFLHIKEVTAEVTWRTDGTTMTSQKTSEFLTVPQVIYKRYKSWATGKPGVIAQQNRRIEHLQRKCRYPIGPSRKIRQQKQNHVSEKVFANKKLNIAVKTCTPTRNHIGWGDTNFANSLSKAIMKLGHNCEVHFWDEWDQPDNHIDIVIHIKGLFRYAPKPYNFNILWIINHPELHTLEEISQFDVVFCASKLYFESLKNNVKIPCFYLPQVTDDEVFSPSKNNSTKDIDLLFVGNNYYKGRKSRKIIQDILETGKQYHLCVVGQGWRNFLDDRYIIADFIEWENLPELYARAKIVLNDHQETMRQLGFVNNRTFDLAALKAFQISNYVEGIEEFGIVTYRSPEDLQRKLDYFLHNKNEREEFAQISNELCARYTFLNAAREILIVINSLFNQGDSRKMKNYETPCSKIKPADMISATHTRRPKADKSKSALETASYPHPKVSIITSCYNCEKFLPECLDSIRNQTMPQWELFLLDDGSTDSTRRIIEQYCRMDQRIKPYYFQDNKGPYLRRNFAIERANSDFIVIQDADDIMCPSKLGVLYREINSDNRLGIVGAFYYIFLDEFRGLKYTDPVELLTEHSDIIDLQSSWQNSITQGSAIIRKTLFDAIGPYDENPFASDLFWLVKAAEYAKYCTDVKFKNIPEYLTFVRVHRNPQTGLLSFWDQRSRRFRYRCYCECKMRKIRPTLAGVSHTDLKNELRNCVCSDFLERFKDHIIRWESVPLANNVIPELLGNSVWLFNKSFYVSCVSMLRGIEQMQPNIETRFRNYDLLRAMAFFALDMKKQSLMYLNREIQNHNNPAAKQFISDYFEGPHFTKEVQNGNPEKAPLLPQGDVQKWCAENSDLYELQVTDTKTVPQTI